MAEGQRSPEECSSHGSAEASRLAKRVSDAWGALQLDEEDQLCTVEARVQRTQHKLRPPGSEPRVAAKRTAKKKVIGGCSLHEKSRRQPAGVTGVTDAADAAWKQLCSEEERTEGVFHEKKASLQMVEGNRSGRKQCRRTLQRGAKKVSRKPGWKRAVASESLCDVAAAQDAWEQLQEAENEACSTLHERLAVSSANFEAGERLVFCHSSKN